MKTTVLQIQGDAHQFRLIIFFQQRFVRVQVAQFCKDLGILVAVKHMLYIKDVNRSTLFQCNTHLFKMKRMLARLLVCSQHS